jgi:hypothetical protein
MNRYELKRRHFDGHVSSEPFSSMEEAMDVAMLSIYTELGHGDGSDGSEESLWCRARDVFSTLVTGGRFEYGRSGLEWWIETKPLEWEKQS